MAGFPFVATSGNALSADDAVTGFARFDNSQLLSGWLQAPILEGRNLRERLLVIDDKAWMRFISGGAETGHATNAARFAAGVRRRRGIFLFDVDWRSEGDRLCKTGGDVQQHHCGRGRP